MKKYRKKINKIQENVLKTQTKISEDLYYMIQNPYKYEKEMFEKYYLTSMVLDSLEFIGEPDWVTLKCEEKEKKEE
ncbi:hypothetical protein OTK55_06530 [Methanosphaera sp. Vir-13MRS]|uniref:hypothetical protein n=1 Tax=Candidatus Methanosphaera massiliense TaxID=3017187 RepID=UPI0023803D97|nr:hypothetical protein [Candidatus Methanosphaera massiliense]MDE4078671.1 hypothetical protein [Candidatus Methanosphaera massiliense]